MKAYPAFPACKSDSCHQGDKPCKTEALCMVGLHRVTPEQVMDREYDEITMEEDAPRLLYVLVGVIALVCVGIVALPFLMGAV